MFSTATLTAVVASLATQHVLSGLHEAPTLQVLGALGITDLALFVVVRSVSKFLHLNVVFFSVFFVFTAIRRLYLHPLSSWPGHKLAALSKVYEAYLYKTGVNAAVIRELHRKHGDFLRTGPNEVAINNVEALQLFSRQTYDISRGPFYQLALTVGAWNVLTARDRHEHRVLRSIWDQGFKSTAINQYSPRVEMHIDRFIEILEQTEGKFVNCVPLIDNMTFDM
jgi:hypothetical protein